MVSLTGGLQDFGNSRKAERAPRTVVAHVQLPRFENSQNIEINDRLGGPGQRFLVLDDEGGAGCGAAHLRLLRNDFAVLPDIDWSSVGAGGLTGGFRGAAQGTADGLCEVLGCSFSVDSFHGPRSSNRGLTPELSYTVQASAKRR